MGGSGPPRGFQRKGGLGVERHGLKRSWGTMVGKYEEKMGLGAEGVVRTMREKCSVKGLEARETVGEGGPSGAKAMVRGAREQC